jgi:hypothetical protein
MFEIENGQRINWWESCPFYVNKVAARYGPTIAIKCSNRDITFICTPRDNAIALRTVVKKFDPRQ